MLLENYWNLIPTDFIFQVCFLAKIANLKVFNDQRLFFYLHYQSLIKYQREENCHKFLFSSFYTNTSTVKTNTHSSISNNLCHQSWSLHEVDLKQINCPQKPNNHQDSSFENYNFKNKSFVTERDQCPRSRFDTKLKEC